MQYRCLFLTSKMHTISLLKFFNLPKNSQLTFVRAFSGFNSIPGKDYYKTLELEKGCSDKDVRDAYIRLSKEHHPDRNPEKIPSVSEKRFVEINEAYSVLSKPAARRRYDAYQSTWDSNQEFESSYDELLHRYNQRKEWMRKRNEERAGRMGTPLRVDRLLLLVISAMFFVGLVEFSVVKRVVQGPDEIIEGMPIFHSNLVEPDFSRMSVEQQSEYQASKRRVIENTVRLMKAENDSRQREQDRLRVIIQHTKERQGDFEE